MARPVAPNSGEADYLLYYRRGFPIAVVEAKESGLPARERRVNRPQCDAEMLGLQRFAYATVRRSRRIIEIISLPLAPSARSTAMRRLMSCGSA
ncbi:MAG: hypothetical protein R3F08_13335 [Dokdonella sp.]